MVVGAVLGAGFGAGLWVLIGALAPQRIDLAAAFAPERGIRPAAWLDGENRIGARGLQRLQYRLEALLSRWAITTPDTDLSVIELARGQFLLQRVAAVVGGLLVGPIGVVVTAAIEEPLVPAIPAAVGVLLAVAGWWLVGYQVRERAEDRRREMRYALVAYLTLVALHRAAGSGTAMALEQAAASSSAWTIRRIQQRVASAVRAGKAPWDGLAALGDELGIDELADLASIADTAGSVGAGVYSTLLARAVALRNELQSREEAAAAIMSARMVLPKAMLGIVTILFLLYPAVTGLAGN